MQNGYASSPSFSFKKHVIIGSQVGQSNYIYLIMRPKPFFGYWTNPQEAGRDQNPGPGLVLFSMLSMPSFPVATTKSSALRPYYWSKCAGTGNEAVTRHYQDTGVLFARETRMG